MGLILLGKEAFMREEGWRVGEAFQERAKARLEEEEKLTVTRGFRERVSWRRPCGISQVAVNTL